MTDPLQLISGYLDHGLTDAELAELEAWVLADSNNAMVFALRAVVHSHNRDVLAGEVNSRLPQLQLPGLFETSEDLNDIEADPRSSLGDAMIMQALIEPHEDETPLSDGPGIAPLVGKPAGRRRWFSLARRLGIIGAAAMILLCAGLFAWHFSSHPVATFTASDGSMWEQTDRPPALGEALSAGTALQLTQGFVEFKYPSGAKIVIEGPAQFVLNSFQQLTLLHGRVTATVPVAAHGFSVTTPVGQIVDLGTEFGVNVVSDTVVQTQVFVGKVEAQPKGGTGQSAVLITAGEAATVSETAVTMMPAFAEDQFVRDIHRIVTPFPTHSTGAGLRQGVEDPYWTITSLPNQLSANPRPAQVCQTHRFYAPDDQRSMWVSTLADLPSVSAGHYTFSTTFDLSGFDPKTASLHLLLSADDEVVELRLNGHVVSVAPISVGNWYNAMRPLEIDDYFVPGVNHLEIVVNNDFKQMGLKAELHGTAVRNPDGENK